MGLAGSWFPCCYISPSLPTCVNNDDKAQMILSSCCCGRSYFSQNKRNRLIQTVALHTSIWWTRVARLRSAWRWRWRERERERHTHTHTDGRCLDMNLKWSVSVWRIRNTYKTRDEGFFAVLRESAERRRKGGGERDEFRSLTPCLMSRCDCNRGVCGIFFYNELLWIFFTALASLVPFSSRGGSCGGVQISTRFQRFKVARKAFFWSIFLSHLAISVHGTAEDFPLQFCKHCGVAENARNETSSVCSCLFVWRAVWKQTDQGSKQSSRSQVPWINCYTFSVFSSCGHFLGRSVVLFLLLNALPCVFLTVAAPLWTPIAETVELSPSMNREGAQVLL
jgi:hypothetical protein